MEIKMTTLRWLIDTLVPVLTGIIGWMAGRRKQKNDFLSELQTSIDLLSKKNGELLKQVVELNDTVVSLRKENGALRGEVAALQSEVIALRKENGDLRSEVEGLRQQLEGVKTITRVKSN